MVVVGVAGLGVRAALDVRGEAVGEVLAVGLPADGRRVGGRDAVGVLLQRPVGLLLPAVQQALLVGVGEEGGHRVARHDVGLDCAVAPLGQPAALLVDLDDRDRHVAGLAGREQREELGLGAVGVPQRPVLVIGEALGAVDLLVPAGVAPVDVAADVGREEGPVQGRVEGAAQGVVAAPDLDAVQPLLPGALGAPAHGVERVPALGAQVERGTARVHVGQGGGGLDGAVLRGVEADVGAVPAALRARGHGAVVPGAVGGEGPVESGDRVDRVRLGVLAEAASGDRGAHRAAVQDLDLGADVLVQRLAGVEQDVGLVGGREGVALHAGAFGGGQLRVDTGVEADPVVAGARLLVVVAEGGGVLRVVRLGDVAGGRQYRQVAAESAADAGEVDQGEAPDVGV
ncbi:hypothetical protein SVIOM342S_00464 [Streptomyces violaceorubidus]